MSPDNVVSIIRTIADILILPLIGTLWQSTIKIAKLETKMDSLHDMISHLNNTIMREEHHRRNVGGD